MRVSGRRISNRAISTERFWQIAILAAAGTIGTVSYADAALYYYQDPDPGYYRPAPTVQPRRQRTQRRSAGKNAVAEKETGAKPQGPLIIAVSIDKQKVRIFDDNGVFAEAPVSTGMRGHPTPTGVFSVIQKHKFHHSNIYSGAPMPYMQRITWSGVAMHAGVLPGYPASHGCIRMPMSFAVKMWNWTKMGARVFVTPGEIMTPVSISHPLLATMKVVPPQPVAADEPPADKPTAVKADKGAPEAKPASSEANLELRSTVGHIDAAKPAATEASDSNSLRDQTHTADASGDTRVTKTPATMSDAPAGSNAPPREAVAATTDNTPPAIKDGAAGDASKSETKSEPKKPGSEAVAVKHDETVAVDNRPVEAKPADTAEAKPSEVKPADTKATEAATGETKPTEAAAKKPEQAALATTATNDMPKVEAKPEESRAEPPKAGPAKTEAATSEAKPSEAKSSEAKSSEAKSEGSVKSDDKVKAAAAAADAKKDQARLAETNKPVVAKPEPPKRTGQIAVFISRKDSKLYVRQNFAPLFEVSVTIAASDRPLGTHVFTAETEKNDANLLHWSVVSLPMSAKSLQRNEDEERVSRRRKVATAGPVAMKPLPVPDSPAEALDRITIPADAMARFTEALATGGSIIVSDQGINQGETGEGTDFIVSMR
jgi:lipoprotein-anchoring transpeptidase ErfK/SrfK